jgi:hypothetical protein
MLDEILADEFTFHFIPDGSLVQGSADVSVIESGCDDIVLEYPFCRFGPGLSARDVVATAEYLLERARQERGIYALSSATAVKDGRGVVFFGGATNLGKTSCMLELVREGFSFFSDEKTLLDLERYRIIGGSRSVAARKRVLKDLLGTQEEFYALSHRSVCDAALLMYPHIDNGLAEPIQYRFNVDDLFWHLNREISIPIRGVTRLVKGFTHQLDSLDTKDLTKKRTALCRSFAAQVPCYYIQGSMAQIGAFVQRQLEYGTPGNPSS